MDIRFLQLKWKQKKAVVLCNFAGSFLLGKNVRKKVDNKTCK